MIKFSKHINVLLVKVTISTAGGGTQTWKPGLVYVWLICDWRTLQRDMRAHLSRTITSKEGNYHRDSSSKSLDGIFRKAYTILLPLTHAQGVKQSVCPSVVVVVVVVVGTKIARSRVLGVCAWCKHNQSIDIGEKLVCMGFKKAC